MDAVRPNGHLVRERAEALAGAMSGRHILVVGDVMLDRYIWGDVSRISPEAPVPVVESTRQSHRLGAAVNVAANLAALGATVELVAVVGDDMDGRSLGSLIERSGIDPGGLVVCPGRPTTVKTRVIARNQQVVRVDAETTEDVGGESAAALAARAADALQRADGVIVSDYGKGVVTAALLGVLLPAARERPVPVAVDPKEAHFRSYIGVDVITPNVKEAGDALGRRLSSDEDVDRAGRELRERLDASAVLITRGERGLSLFTAGPPLHLAARARDVYDVTGAGDTVVSVFALVRAAGGSHAEAADLANRAAGLVVREVGTAVANPAAILATFEGESGSERA